MFGGGDDSRKMALKLMLPRGRLVSADASQSGSFSARVCFCLLPFEIVLSSATFRFFRLSAPHF